MCIAAFRKSTVEEEEEEEERSQILANLSSDVPDHVIGDVELQRTVEKQVSAVEGARKVMMVERLVQRFQTFGEDES